MNTENPFALPGRWYKGCLHAHSTASDGELTPEEALNWYHDHGYHFVALTDHNVPSQAHTLAEDWITLAGIEVDGVDPVAGLYHLIGLGLELPRVEPARAASMQDSVDRLRAAGAIVCIAHPYWSGQCSAHLIGVDGCFALEVYNGGCEVDDAKGFSHVHWDDLLAAGRRLWGLAVDDAHWRTGDRDAGLGWVWVKAQTPSQQAILEALEQGHFYASCGPEIYGIDLDAGRGQINVRCSPVVAIDLIGNGPLSRRIHAPGGQTLTEASYRLQGGERYVRVSCLDSDGRRAWTNPIFLEDDAEWLS